MEIDKSLMTENGKPLTQSLFLEIGYSDFAVYTLKDNTHVYNGKEYPSIKQLYLELADPTEYEFANKYFLGWRHWLRIAENKQIKSHILEWREELEYKLRSEAVKHMINSAKTGNYQASKWLVDRGWMTRPAGRPTKADIDSEKAFQARVNDEYAGDIFRLKAV